MEKEGLIIGGIYQHFKNRKFYKVIGRALHSETLEELVVYEPLYENPLAKLWARPIGMFLEEVVHEGERQPRFRFAPHDFGDKELSN